jgi:DNA-binding NarL/FixJ family response regulator
MDVRMKGMDGVEATRRLKRTPDAPPVLILTTFDDDAILSSALRAGAAGFVLKDAPAEELIRATRLVAAGEAWLDPAVTGRVLATYRDSAPPADIGHALEALTPRERDVLRLIGRGLTNQEIADTLSIGEATVKSHVGHILDKLDLRDRAAAIVFAFDHGLVQPAP